MDYEHLRSIVELGSLALTVPLVFLCCMVIYECYVPLKHCIQKVQGDKKICWIIAGIFFGFAGNLIDNIYWAIPWSSNYLGLKYTEDLIKFGVFPNIFFRQILTAFAAYCHLRAFIAPEHNRDSRWLHIIIIITFIFGVFYVFSLWHVKGMPTHL